MYCKNCGKETLPNASVCLGCGVNIGEGSGYCANCGEAVTAEASVCTKCGAALNNVPLGAKRKSKLVAGILGILLGGWGVHNFYLGYNGKGIAQILLSFCFGIGAIWGLIEGILILCDHITTDANGIPLE
ncbi:MAG: TM2 domain-containing protein [Clostridia bacterium]|nr:TM2 domain-containing protein [Clostridia bacterium]